MANLKAARIDQVTALDKALAQQATATAALETVTEAKSKADGKLAVSQTLTWPTAFRQEPGSLALDGEARAQLEKLLEVRSVSLVSPEAFAAWFTGLSPELAAEFGKDKRFAAFFDKAGKLVGGDKPDPKCQGPAASVPTCVGTQSGAYAQFQRVGMGLHPCPADRAATDCASYDRTVQELKEDGSTEAPLPPKGVYGRHARDTVLDRGLFIRQPALGVLWVCPGDAAAKPDLNVAPCDPQKKLYRSDPVSTPQLGQLRYLPFSNGPFEANELALTLREDGSIDSFAYKKTRAAGTAMVASAADAADQYKAYRDIRDKKRTDAVTAARADQIAQLQYQIDLLTKQKDILKLQKPDEDDPSSAVKTQTIQIEAQTALLAAKLAQLKAESSLAEAGGS